MAKERGKCIVEGCDRKQHAAGERGYRSVCQKHKGQSPNREGKSHAEMHPNDKTAKKE